MEGQDNPVNLARTFMSFLDFLTGKPRPLEPAVLRERLFAAAAARDGKALLDLCRRHAEPIAQHFPAWQKVPEDVRSSPARLQTYANGLLGVARCFAEQLGRPELMQLLQGGAGGNPIQSWQQAMARVRRLVDALDFDQAISLLAPQIDAVRRLQGGDARRMLAISLGTLAECHFQRGAAQEGVAPAREALTLCQEDGDREGVAAYTGTLYELHRYRGNGPEAAIFAWQHADALRQQGDQAQARRYERLATLAQKGEPLNRIVVVIGGAEHEVDEVPPLTTGSIQFRYARNRRSLARVDALLQQGTVAGGLEQFAQAAELFQRAASLDPYDPEPRYQLGLTLVYLRRYAEAIEQYRAVESLAPGWFQARTDLWLAHLLAEGAISLEAFVALVSLEGPDRLPEKESLARRWLDQLPEFAPLHHALGRVLGALGRAYEARAAHDRGLQYVREPDLKTRLMVDRAALEDPGTRLRIELLYRAVELNGNLQAAAMASVMLRSERD